MRRRSFITLLGGAGATWPLAARGQQAAMPVIGLLSGNRLDDRSREAIRSGLAETGFVEGRNVTIDYRSADGRYDRLPALAAELVRRPVNVIIAILATEAAHAAKAATTSVPIVFANGSDPVQQGLVTSFNRPGGNVTGVTFLTNMLAPKRLEVLHELLPAATAVGFIVNPANSNVTPEMKDMETAAQTLGLQLRIHNASNDRDLETAFTSLIQQKVGALVFAADAFFSSSQHQLIALAARHRMPAMYSSPLFVAAGGLMGYGASRVDADRLAGNYAGRILKGDKPGDLPVQQSTKVELAINLKTAKELGLTFPITLLGRADEVIE